MNKLITLSIITIVIFLFQGCLAEKTEVITKLETQIKDDPKSAELHAKIAYQHYSESLKNKNIFSLEKAYEEAQKAHKLAPNNLPIKGLLYDISFSKTMFMKDKGAAQQIKKLFPDLYAANFNVAPPSYIDFLFVSNSKDAQKNQIKLLKSALQENPRFTNSYINLAVNYADLKRYNLATDTLQRGVKIAQDKQKIIFHAMLAEIYMEQSIVLESKNQCTSNDTTLSKKIIKEAKTAIQLDSNLLDMYALLSQTYSRLGQKELALHAAKTYHDKANNTESQYTYESALLEVGKKEKFFKAVNENTDIFHLAYAAFYDQNWNDTVKYYSKYIKDTKSKNFYRYIMLSLAKGKKENKNAMQNELKNLPPDIKWTDWKKNLKSHLIGELSEDQLLQLANTKCKKTEALFHIGFIAYIDNDNEKAYRYFQKVLDEKLYAYTEYIASYYFLKEKK